MIHVVRKGNTCYYLAGEALLLYRENESAEHPDDALKMLIALYDRHQWDGGMQDGDKIETPHGLFLVEGVHVIPADHATIDLIEALNPDHEVPMRSYENTCLMCYVTSSGDAWKRTEFHCPNCNSFQGPGRNNLAPKTNDFSN